MIVSTPITAEDELPLPPLQTEVFIVRVAEDPGDSRRVSSDHFNLAFFSVLLGDTEKIYCHRLHNTATCGLPARQKKALTDVFHKFIIPKIFKDAARDLFYEMHYPKKSLKDNIEEYQAVRSYTVQKNKELRRKMSR